MEKCSINKRLATEMADLVLVALIAFAGIYIMASASGKGGLTYVILFPMCYFLYQLLCSLLGGGKTLGAWITKAVIVGENEKQPSAVDYTVRAIVKTMPYLVVVLFPNIWVLTGILAVGYWLFPFFQKENRAIHDLVGETYVMTYKKKEILVSAVQEFDAEAVSHVGKEVEPVVENAEVCNEQVDMEAEPEKMKSNSEPEKDMIEESAYLIGISGEHKGKMYAVTYEVVLGRECSCNIIFRPNMPEVSRRHCKISYDKHQDIFMLTDLNSTYGTFLRNGEKIPAGETIVLHDGDEFSIGEEQRFLLQGGVYHGYES